MQFVCLSSVSVNTLLYAYVFYLCAYKHNSLAYCMLIFNYSVSLSLQSQRKINCYLLYKNVQAKGMAGLVSVDHSGFSVSFNEYLRYLSESLGTLKSNQREQDWQTIIVQEKNLLLMKGGINTDHHQHYFMPFMQLRSMPPLLQ
jgi:hypothetical protein